MPTLSVLWSNILIKNLKMLTYNEWVNGETFLYLGRAYRLSLVSDQNSDLKLHEGRFCLNRSLIDTGGTKAARKSFESYYSKKGLKRIEDRLKYYSQKVGVTSSSIKVKDLGFRWASCSKANVLSFHWKCMMAPPKIIDYIVVHELCHIHQRNHSSAYWNEVDKVMPDYRERKQWLRTNGANLDL